MTSYLKYSCSSRNDAVSTRPRSRSISRASWKCSSQTSSYYKSSNGRPDTGLPLSETIVLAIDATKEISRNCLEWILENVAQPGDQVVLVALVPLSTSTLDAWSFPVQLVGDRKTSPRLQEAAARIYHSCHCITEQVQKLYDSKKVKLKTKLITAATRGVIAVEGKLLCATWVVLDRHLKKEARSCLEQLNCNLLILSSLSCQVLRLNTLLSSQSLSLQLYGSVSESSSRGEYSSLELPKRCQKFEDFLIEERSNTENEPQIFSGSNSWDPNGSELGAPFSNTEQGTSLPSSSEPGSSPYFCLSPDWNKGRPSGEGALHLSCTDVTFKPSAGSIPESRSGYRAPSQISSNQNREKRLSIDFMKHRSPKLEESESSRLKAFTCSSHSQEINSNKKIPGQQESSRQKGSSKSNDRKKVLLCPSQENVKLFDEKAVLIKPFPRDYFSQRILSDQNQTNSISFLELKSELLKRREREVPSIVRRATVQPESKVSGSLPLCSICQHKTPLFGMPPKAFSYGELKLATNGFSKVNFLAEGGFGCVHKGLLPNGQAVAVKQYKMASSQGDNEFCSEVEVLSCAQHRNVVMLIGYCIEDTRRLLVYEFVCNGSLSSHLYGQNRRPLDWRSRQKIALGTARGLRYLHEECRVGCIVHLDLRPSNILLTHDFEPMVGDFGLARWKPQGDSGFKMQVTGTFGYMAPEYLQDTQITEKADIYSYGVILLELVTGRKAVDVFGPRGQQFLTEWARPFLEEQMWQEMVDPQLKAEYNAHEVSAMLQAASLCIERNPHQRPRLSRVLRILEGDT